MSPCQLSNSHYSVLRYLSTSMRPNELLKGPQLAHQVYDPPTPHIGLSRYGLCQLGSSWERREISRD